MGKDRSKLKRFLAATSLSRRLLDCVLEKRTTSSCYRLPNRGELFTYGEKQHRHREYHCNDHSQAHGQDEDVIFALVLVKQIRLHIVYGKDSKISVLANRQFVHKNHCLTTAFLNNKWFICKQKSMEWNILELKQRFEPNPNDPIIPD